MSRERCLTCRAMTSCDHSRCSSDPLRRASCDGVGDGGERVPQLVGEHGEELVLAPVGLLEPLGLMPELVLHPFPLGEVEREPGHAQRRAVAGVLAPAPDEDPMRGPVGPDRPVLDLEVGPPLERRRHRFVDAGPVVGVDGLEEVVVGERGLRGPSVVRLAGLRAGERPAGEVELPAAELADIQGEAQLALALPEGLGLPLAFGGVVAVRVLAPAVAEGGPDRADEGRDRDRPLDQRHVAHRLEGPGGLRRLVPRGGQDQQGDVRPGRLRLEHAEEARRGVGEDRLLGSGGPPRPPGPSRGRPRPCPCRRSRSRPPRRGCSAVAAASLAVGASRRTRSSRS